MADLAPFPRDALRSGPSGRRGHAALVAALKTDQALLQAAHERVAEADRVIAARGRAACMLTSRDRDLLVRAIGEAG